MGVDFKLTGVLDFDKLEVVKNSLAEVEVPVGYIDGQIYATVVPHNLGYIPGIICYVTPPLTFPSDPSETPLLVTYGVAPFTIIGIADTNVSEVNATFNVYGDNDGFSSLAGTWRFNYFLLRSRGSPAGA